MEEQARKAPNPFFKRIKSLNDIKGPTHDEVSELLWGHKDGPQAPPPLPPIPEQGGQHGKH